MNAKTVPVEHKDKERGEIHSDAQSVERDIADASKKILG